MKKNLRCLPCPFPSGFPFSWPQPTKAASLAQSAFDSSSQLHGFAINQDCKPGETLFFLIELNTTKDSLEKKKSQQDLVGSVQFQPLLFVYCSQWRQRKLTTRLRRICRERGRRECALIAPLPFPSPLYFLMWLSSWGVISRRHHYMSEERRKCCHQIDAIY